MKFQSQPDLASMEAQFESPQAASLEAHLPADFVTMVAQLASGSQNLEPQFAPNTAAQKSEDAENQDPVTAKICPWVGKKRAQPVAWWAMDHRSQRAWERSRPQKSEHEHAMELETTRKEGAMLKKVSELKLKSYGKPVTWKQVVAELIADKVFDENSAWAKMEMYEFAPKLFGNGKKGTALPEIKPQSRDEHPKFGIKTEWQKNFLANRIASTAAAAPGLDNIANVRINYNIDYAVSDKLIREYRAERAQQCPDVVVTAPSDAGSEAPLVERIAPIVVGTSGPKQHDYNLDFGIIDKIKKEYEDAANVKEVNKAEREGEKKKTGLSVRVLELMAELVAEMMTEMTLGDGMPDSQL